VSSSASEKKTEQEWQRFFLSGLSPAPLFAGVLRDFIDSGKTLEQFLQDENLNCESCQDWRGILEFSSRNEVSE
jgi:hypothetical protein